MTTCGAQHAPTVHELATRARDRVTASHLYRATATKRTRHVGIGAARNRSRLWPNCCKSRARMAGAPSATSRFDDAMSVAHMIQATLPACRWRLLLCVPVRKARRVEWHSGTLYSRRLVAKRWVLEDTSNAPYRFVATVCAIPLEAEHRGAVHVMHD